MRRIVLPACARRFAFAPLCGLYWLPYVMLYQLTNRWHLVEPQPLPLTWLDQALPFVPALLPLYVSYVALVWWTAARSADDRELSRMLYVTYLQLAVALLCFVLVPVRYPRELFYPPEALGWADAFWRWFDTPTNCLPSLHVANGLALAQLNWTRRWRGVHTLWALGVAASTVLVKQHYVADAVAGAGLYLLARAFLTRLVIAPVAVGGGSRVPQATTYGWPAGSLTSP